MSDASARLLATTHPFPAHLDQQTAQDIINVARSTDPEDADALVEVAMRRGLRHVRLAVEAIGTQVSQLQQEQALVQQDQALGQQEKVLEQSKLLLWVTVLAAVAAVANAIATFVN
jgi:hypothetical protein